MKPYYQDGSVTIYHGDCREIVPTLGRFDLLLTDPPYGMQYKSNWRYVKHDKIAGDESLPVETINEAILRCDRAAYVFCRWDNISTMKAPKSCMVWVKNNWTAGDLKHEHGRQWEACLFYPLEHHEFINRIPDVIYCARAKNDCHPTEKPVSLISTIIMANVGDTILDPFAGSGTTGRAAKDCGRKATLIEINEKYCEVAANRMRQESLFAC